MMLTMQGIGYVKGAVQTTKNGYYKVNVCCKASKDEWRYITIIYGEMFNKYPMQYIEEGDALYFEIRNISIDVHEGKSYVAGFAINMSTVGSQVTQTNHDEVKEPSADIDDAVAYPPKETDYVPF